MSTTSVYVDSNVFIAPLIYEEAGGAKAAAEVLKLVEEGQVTAYTSTLTWDEVVWVVRRALGKPDSVQAGHKLLAFPNLRFVPASEVVVRSAQQIVSDHGVAPRDALHLASALSRNLPLVLSDDPDLDIIPQLKRESAASYLAGLPEKAEKR